jgi:hypothetical protein
VPVAPADAARVDRRDDPVRVGGGTFDVSNVKWLLVLLEDCGSHGYAVASHAVMFFLELPPGRRVRGPLDAPY